MDTLLFLLCLFVAVAAPLLAIAYLRGILRRVLDGMCPAEGSAEFWIRCATLLATSGSVLLLLLFGHLESGMSVAEALRRALMPTLGAVFVSVALIARNVWQALRPPFPTDAAAFAAAAVRERT